MPSSNGLITRDLKESKNRIYKIKGYMHACNTSAICRWDMSMTGNGWIHSIIIYQETRIKAQSRNAHGWNI